MDDSKFLGKDAADGSHTWKEWHIQSYISTQSHRGGYMFSAGMEGASKGKAGGAKAKATGQQAGEPDLRYYLDGGKLVLIELKTISGKLSKIQKERISALRKLGFNVCIVYAESPMHGWTQVKHILENGLINIGDIR